MNHARSAAVVAAGSSYVFAGFQSICCRYQEMNAARSLGALAGSKTARS
jgi:hypothetical protein